MAIDSVDAADSVATHRYGDEAGQAVCSSLRAAIQAVEIAGMVTPAGGVMLAAEAGVHASAGSAGIKPAVGQGTMPPRQPAAGGEAASGVAAAAPAEGAAAALRAGQPSDGNPTGRR